MSAPATHLPAPPQAHSYGNASWTLGLRCLVCGGALGSLPQPLSLSPPGALPCSRCEFALTSQDGIWKALPVRRAQYFRQFVDEYQTVRAAEGRGSLDSNFYLELPFADLSGRNCWQWEIRARSYHYFVRRILPALGTGSLRILDLGAGNGWLSHRLALLGHRPVAVDLLVNPQDAGSFNRIVNSPRRGIGTTSVSRVLSFANTTGVSIWDAASSDSTQSFLLVGTLFLLPIILMYSGWSYWVFRGKVRADIGYH